MDGIKVLVLSDQDIEAVVINPPNQPKPTYGVRKCAAVYINPHDFLTTKLLRQENLGNKDIIIVEFPDSSEKTYGAEEHCAAAIKFIKEHTAIPIVAVFRNHADHIYLTDTEIPRVTGKFNLSKNMGQDGILSIMRGISFPVPKKISHKPPLTVSFGPAEKGVTFMFKGKPGVMTPKQAEMLAILADGQFHGRDRLIREMRRCRDNGEISKDDINLIKVHMSKLRKALGMVTEEEIIETKWYAGFVTRYPIIIQRQDVVGRDAADGRSKPDLTR